MANEIYGGDIILKVDTLVLCNEKSASSSLTADALETTSKSSADEAKTYIAGETGGTISATGLYAINTTGVIGYKDLMVKLIAKTVVNYKLGKFDAGGLVETGKGIITACNLEGADNNAIPTISITIQKTGKPTFGVDS